MRIIKKNELNRSYTLFLGGEINKSSYCVQMVLHHLLDHLLSSHLYVVDDVEGWSCEHTGKESLKEYCESHVLDSHTIKWIWNDLLEMLLETEEFLLDMDCLYLNESEIYINVEDRSVSACYVPFEKTSVWEKLTDVAQFLLGYLDQRDAQAVQMAYGIYQYLSQGGKNVDELWKLIVSLEQTKSEWEQEDTEVTVSLETKRAFPVWRWVYCGLMAALSIFLLGFVALNEWHLLNVWKILLLTAAVLLGVADVFLWKKWRYLFQKEQFLDEEDELEKEDEFFELPKLVRKDTKEDLVISRFPAFIGKLPEVVQVLIPEPTVSRIHAKLFVKGGEYYIEDLNSTNGTYLNGIRLETQKPARLKGNDVLVFADICCYFQLSNR